MASYIQSSLVALGAAALLLLLYPIGTAIYNLFFHPLRKFPGPVSARASILPFVINRGRGLQVSWTKELHEQYGDVVRVAPDQLSFISPEAWKDIYGHAIGGKGGMSKDFRFYGPPAAGGNDIVRSGEEDHSRQRRLLSHAFSDKALREQEPLIQRLVSLLVARLQDVAHGPNPVTDMVRMYNCTTFDVMGDLAFGEPLGLLERSEYTPWVASIFAAIKMGVMLATINNYLPAVGAVVRRFFIPQSMIEKRKAHAAFSSQRVNRRLERATDRPDIWTFVLRNSGKEGGGGGSTMSVFEMHANASLLMMAGTETTATLLSGLTYQLLRSPAQLARLTAEVRSAFASPDAMNMVTLTQLPFLHACLEEALRLYPPVPVGLPRVVPPGPGRVVCGRPVAPGTAVYLSHYAAYRSARNFHEPDAFLPERWLPDADARFANDKRNVVEPFSYGPRNCIGKNLAYHEMRLILANTLWHFDLELCPESKDWGNQKVYTVWEKGSLMCKLKPVASS